MHEGLFAELRGGGFDVEPGVIGENVTTGGIDLLALPTGARLRLGPNAVIEITGLRNPCRQLDVFRPGGRCSGAVQLAILSARPSSGVEM
jgi:MOSC domain-containing protein YiiM